MTDGPGDATAPEEEADADEPEEESAPERERAAPPAAEPVRFSLTTLLAVTMLVGAGSFAAGRSFAPAAPPPPIAESPPPQPPMGGGGLMGPSGPPGGPGGPGMGSMGSEGLPPGHPPTGAGDPAGSMGVAPGAVGAVTPSALSWTAPPRWQQVPNPSTMRLATYRVPHAPGDAEDPELTITQAGGSVEANAQRWIGQFGPEGAKSAKQSTRTVGTLAVAIVEVEGKFVSGMGREGREEERWAMFGAIVQTPGMPHFFKLTGPVKSVKAARAEFDALIGSVALKK